VAVHKTAIQYIHWHGYLLDERQRQKAMPAIEAHAHCYRNKPYDAEHICGAALAVSRGNQVLRKRALRILKSFLPTGEALVDKNLIEMLMRAIKHEDGEATYVAGSILKLLLAESRDQFNSYENQYRADFFNWLQTLPRKAYEQIKSPMIDAAALLAKRDPWESCHFASIFSHFGDYAAEANVLRLAAEAVKGEKSLEQMGFVLGELQKAAEGNAAKQEGNQELASRRLDSVIE
jgi:uncharacterized protein YqeY